MRSRCKSCGCFIRNHSYCQRCVENYRDWKAWIDAQPFGTNSNQRDTILATMEREMER